MTSDQAANTIQAPATVGGYGPRPSASEPNDRGRRVPDQRADAHADQRAAWPAVGCGWAARGWVPVGMTVRLSAAPALAGGALLGAVFGLVGILRANRPLHASGVVFDAEVRRTGGSAPTGCGWLDAPGTDRGLVRLSRAVGLPDPLPDVLGLALTFRDTGAARCDLLLATTGLAPGARHVLLPRRDPGRARYTSLLPYRGPCGPVLLAAVPVGWSPLRFQLMSAGLVGGWQRFGTLDLSGAGDPDPRRAPRFDPVRHPLPGLTYYPALAALREPAYAAARWTAPPGRPEEPSGGRPADTSMGPLGPDLP